MSRGEICGRRRRLLPWWRAIAAGLLVMPALDVHANGGTGGTNSGTGPSGGNDQAVGTGDTGDLGAGSNGGGGGGAGTTGGNGGNGGNGTGGTGGTAPGGSGGPGIGGGAGGGGGAHGVATAPPFSIGVSTSGGNGGAGGSGVGLGGNGGGGGAGGYGAVFTGPGAVTISAGVTVQGGTGGAGGTGTVQGGGGGSGGSGIDLLLGTAGVVIINNGTVNGGTGGAGGNGAGAGAGGTGIHGSDLTIINAGTISGGMSGDGQTRNDAIRFTTGTNTVELHASSIIVGRVRAVTGGSDRLVLGGTSDGSFDASLLGPQYTDFATIEKTGSATWTITGTPTVAPSSGWTVSQGLVNFSTARVFGGSQITLNGGGLQWAAGNTADISAQLAPLGIGGGTFDTNGNDVTLAAAISGSGGLVKQGLGVLNLAGANTYGGPTSVTAGTLAVNGSITSDLTVGAAGTVSGTGSIFGNAAISGTLAPGNSIGTLSISGNFTQAAGSIYQVEVNAQGQGDRVNIGGTATIAGGTVQVLAQPGNYRARTTYTILNAAGGRSGFYDGVTSNFAFLTPSLSYDANNVFLILALEGGGGFLMSAYTPNQKAVGAALNQSFANATGDYATVIGALAGLSAFQGPAALNAISGEQYADFGTMNVNNAAMFMNAVGQQMAAARGAAAASGQRAALAQACDVPACDAKSPFSVWASGLGGFGAVAGDYNASTATYNYAGAALGIDYRIDPRLLVGLGTAYTAGNLWVDSFPGKGWTNSVAAAAYGSFTQGGFYADGLAGYAWFGNQLQRQISIPGLQPLTATGSTGANQVLGQLETGYRLGVHAPAAVTVAPFARLQGSSVTQNGFGENGAQSLSLNVQQQTTNSLRTLFGVDLAGAMPVGSDRTLDLGLRLGWQHEFASTTRSITASLAGAPLTAFTVYGATPQTDAAVVSLRGATNVAAGAQMYLRYDGEVGGGTSNHAFNLGLRMQW